MLGVLVVEGGVQGDRGGASLALLRAVPVEFVSAEHGAFCCRHGEGLQAVGEGDGDVLETGEGAQRCPGRIAHRSGIGRVADADDGQRQRRHLRGVHACERSSGAGEADTGQRIGEAGITGQ